PVVLKAADPALRHRVDQLGVQVGLADQEELVEAWAALDSVGAGLRYVQQAAPADRSGVPTVFTITADPSFGALVSFGIGGVATDLLDDRAFRAVPLTDMDAVELIAGPRTAPLLSGYRGSDPVAKEPLRELALKLSALADDVPELQELRLRPVLVGPGGLTVAGAEGRIGPPAVQPDTRRRL